MTQQKQYIFDIETTSLDPLDGRIVCISLSEIGKDEVKTFIGQDEKIVLTDFWEEVEKDSKLIGFNSDSFDIPFIIKRCLINKVRVNNFQTMDIRKNVNSFWTSYNNKSKGTLSDWARILRIKIETDSGSEIPLLFANNKFDEIQKHCIEDIKITKKLYELCQYCNVLGGKN